MSQADSASITNSELLALASRLRDAADDVIANRQLANDMRAAAVLASQWANIHEGWQDPDLSYAALHELDERISDYAKTGAAVLPTDVFLAMLAIDRLNGLIDRLRAFPNAPANYDFRGMLRVSLQSFEVEPFTCEQIENMRAPR